MTEQTKEIQLNLPAMQKMKIFLATPMYGGQCYGLYTKSLMDTTSTLMHHGIEMQIYYLFNESLVTRARNYCVHNFLKSEATHMLFIDSDVSWKAMDLMYMTHLVAENPEKYRIMTALYPKKTIAWEKVLKAAKSGNFDDNPVGLEKVAGDMVFNPDHTAYPDGRAPVYEPVKVREAGTGFMMIERSVFAEYAAAHPELEYTPDHIREGEFSIGEKIHAYFDCIINDQNRYLSEDYMFCENVKKLDIDIWTLPMIELMHSGSYTFQGKLVDMAVNDVHATLAPDDAEKIAMNTTRQNSEK
tara:strand:+ start:7964 stop:8863 length:900 start_codon:yes stop_codon:yes gene_type:complete